MKKLVIILAIVALLCCSMAFVGCNGGADEYDETFVGAISTTTYESTEDAVKGFLEVELSSEAFTAVYVGYTKTQELSTSEIDELAIDDDIKANIVSVEKGEVEYAEQTESESEVVLARLSSNNYKRTVYVVKYKENGKEKFRFYTPASQVGETITQSEYNSIFDADKYVNCTVYLEGENKVNGELAGFTDFLYKFSQGYFYAFSDPDYGHKIYDEATYDCYMFYLDDLIYRIAKGIDCRGWEDAWIALVPDPYPYDYSLSNDTCAIEGNFINLFFESIINSCNAYPFVGLGFGKLERYFEKTASGIAITKERFIDYSNSNEFNKYSTITSIKIDSNFEFEFNVNISNGRITSISAHCSGWLTKNEDQYCEYEMKTSFFDFGNTVIEIPQEVKDALDAYIASNKQ